MTVSASTLQWTNILRLLTDEQHGSLLEHRSTASVRGADFPDIGAGRQGRSPIGAIPTLGNIRRCEDELTPAIKNREPAELYRSLCNDPENIIAAVIVRGKGVWKIDIRRSRFGEIDDD